MTKWEARKSHKRPNIPNLVGPWRDEENNQLRESLSLQSTAQSGRDMRSEANEAKIQKFMEALGRATHGPGRIYFTGGVSAVLLHWRTMTVDVDCKLDPEPAGVFDALPKLKDELDVNIELAAPDDFIPALPDWQERSRFIATHGRIDFYHYDFYSQALAKIERFHSRDETDVAAMLEHGLVHRDQLLELFKKIEPDLKRYPAIEPDAFRDRVIALTTGR